MVDVGVPIAIPDIEVLCHNYHISDVSGTILQGPNGYLITVWVDINDKVDVLAIIE